MSTDAENEAYFSARYAEARDIFTLLGYATFTHNTSTTITTEELNFAGLAVFNLPPGFDVSAIDASEHTVKHEAGHAYIRRLERATGILRATYTEQFRVRFGYPANYVVTGYTAGRTSLEEAWAEVFCNACEGRVVTSKSHLDESVDPLVARAWFQNLSGQVVVVAPRPQPNVKVLWHLSHHSSTRPDGWSGAPDEARWVREALTPLVIEEAALRGIEIVTVDGDLQDHPEFHANYGAFCAAHYEANVHGEGGSFWGRAAASNTAAEDDRFGNIFWKRYSRLVGKPPDRFGWNNKNVTDYYGFRLTSVSTPGILVEHGVGAPNAPDFAWLRQNVHAIAVVWADSLVEFLGLSQEEPVTDQEFIEKYNRLIKPGVDGTDEAIKKVQEKTVLAVRAAGDILAKTNL